MTELPKIVRRDEGDKGGFYLPAPSETDADLGELTYQWEDGNMVLDHTGVREALRGQGAARKLVMHAVSVARREGFKLLPECPYAARVLADAEFDDVRAGTG